MSDAGAGWRACRVYRQSFPGAEYHAASPWGAYQNAGGICLVEAAHLICDRYGKFFRQDVKIFLLFPWKELVKFLFAKILAEEKYPWQVFLY